MNTETLHFKFLKVFCCVLLLQLGWSHALGAVTEANQTRQIQGVITDSRRKRNRKRDIYRSNLRSGWKVYITSTFAQIRISNFLRRIRDIRSNRGQQDLVQHCTGRSDECTGRSCGSGICHSEESYSGCCSKFGEQ